MEIAGNIFTHYRYTTTDIQSTEENDIIKISSHKSDFTISCIKSSNPDNIPLPKNSPFSSWKEARRSAGPLPFTFTYDKFTQKVLIIEGVRQHWKPIPIQLTQYHFDFLSTLNLTTYNLANAFIVENIPYYWKKGKTEQWKP